MRRRGRSRQPVALSTVVGKVLSRSTDLRLGRVSLAWARVVPERVAKNARPAAIRGQTVFVHVKNATWAQELTFLGDQILPRLRAALPDVPIKALRYRVGPLPDLPRIPAEGRRGPPPSAVSEAELPPEVARALAGLRDEALRRSIAHAARQSFGRRVAREGEES